jgi:(hydroxyamino)benzene mutase
VTLPAAAPARHPLDPDPAPSTKAKAVFALGLIGFLLGAFVGGAIPAVVALLMSRQVMRQAYASGGYLTGSAWVARGRRLAWAGIVLALTALVIAAIAGLLHLAASPGGTDFAPNTD